MSTRETDHAAKVAMVELRAALADAGVVVPGLDCGFVVGRSGEVVQYVRLGDVPPATAVRLAAVIRGRDPGAVGRLVPAPAPVSPPGGAAGPVPAVGTVVRDTGHAEDTEERPKVGVVMERRQTFVWLRPVGGGREWTARPGALVSAQSDALRPAVREANRRSARGRGVV